jgi:hypothetical protein
MRTDPGEGKTWEQILIQQCMAECETVMKDPAMHTMAELYAKQPLGVNPWTLLSQ